MEFKPAYPEDNNNVSHNNPLREFVVLLTGVLLVCVAVFVVSGWLVDRAVLWISPKMEAQIFTALSPAVKDSVGQRSPGEDVLQQLVDGLGSCIDVGYPVKVELVTTETANALALPGGRIIVFSGILDKIQSENGLAFVLAHELAHFKHRDHLSGMGRGIVLTAMTAFLTGSDSGLTRLVTPAVSLGTASYSRSREARADSLALRALHCRYGHVGGATEFFRAMQNEERGRGIASYFASHPEAVERIQQLEALQRSQGYTIEAVTSLPVGLMQK